MKAVITLDKTHLEKLIVKYLEANGIEGYKEILWAEDHNEEPYVEVTIEIGSYS